MQILTLEKSQTTRLFWATVVILLPVVALTAKQQDPGVVVAGCLLGIISICPLYLWLLGQAQGLPIWPVFCLVNGITASLPMTQNPEVLKEYTSSEIIIGGITMMGFIILGSVVWLAASARSPLPPKKVIMIRRGYTNRYLFSFVVAGIIFQLNSLFWWFAFPGNILPIVRGIAMSLNTLAIFVLAYYAGRKLLAKQEEAWLIVLTAATGLAGAASLIMVTAAVSVAMLLLGYALGSGRVPWKALAIVFVVLAVLHPGKFAMRATYWGEGREQLTLTGMPEYFANWFNYGLQEVGLLGHGKRDVDRPEATSLFERGGNIHMLLLVQKKTPDEVPFLNGLTYEPIPRLLTPRFLDEGKGVSHAGNILLSVNYGMLQAEETANTSIAWGLVPEAYANFGYLGVAGLAVALALFYAAMSKLTVGVPMTSLRFVLGLMIMGAATNADTMGVFVTSQFQGVVGVSVAALFLMTRQENPFAAEGGEGTQHTGNGRRVKAYGRRQGAEGIRQEDGMPAPGVLTGLIEGASEGRNAGVAVVRKDGVSVGERLAADGGVVRTMPIRMPKRVAAWMPRRVRAAVVAQQRAAADDMSARPADSGGRETGDGHAAHGKLQPESAKPEVKRPRQLAVPIQPYYYRSRKA